MIAKDQLPQHVAFIMDGNGRWAKERGMPRTAGHKEGAKSVRRVVRACRARGIRYLTLYAFSLANWQRPKLEIDALMRLLAVFAEKSAIPAKSGCSTCTSSRTDPAEANISKAASEGERHKPSSAKAAKSGAHTSAATSLADTASELDAFARPKELAKGRSICMRGGLQ